MLGSFRINGGWLGTELGRVYCLGKVLASGRNACLMSFVVGAGRGIGDGSMCARISMFFVCVCVFSAVTTLFWGPIDRSIYICLSFYLSVRLVWSAFVWSRV